MDFKLPDIGEGVHEGELVKWLVTAGQSIQMDQPLVEIMTDKATVELPSPFTGQVSALNAAAGDIIKVGQVILTYESSQSVQVPQSAKTTVPAESVRTGTSSSAASTLAGAPTASISSVTATAAGFAIKQKAFNETPVVPSRASAATAAPVAAAAAVAAGPGEHLATPATRRLARDLGIDLSLVPATGPHGRVTKEDVQKFVGASAAGPQVPVARHTAVSSPLSGVPSVRETLVPFRGIRRKIAEAMTRSRQVIPEFTYVDEVDVTELVAFRKEAKGYAEKQGVKLTYLPFIAKAMIQGLKQFPSLNASLDEATGNIILKNYFNIGIAVDTEAGLVVPNVKDADRKTVLEIAQEIQTLAEKARAGKLALEEMQQGTITITNPGPIGGLITAPVINWPEVAIMGVHKIVRKPVVKAVEDPTTGRVTDQIVIADTMYLSLAVDHRVVDGATAARFVNVVIEHLSNPKLLMLG